MKNIDCTACKIIPNTKFVIFESDYWIISLASDQHWLGRSYVTSKKHVESLSELSASSK
jgi:diadenosine tetraphosphate (Ap4A) HIT family hydrolase